ncbi:MAG: hypothetical protein J6584_09560, partial [Lactobacillus sp.]|nr:hypothetical protein [Lactobacillus sp.]
MIDTKPKSVNTYWKTSIQKTQIVIAFLISSFFLAVGGHVGYAAAFSDANYDINNLVNFEQNILPTQSRSTNNHIERLGMPSTFAVDDSTIPWPTNNDFYLTDNPDGGKIAYVHNAKQLLHAIYGFGTDYKNIDIRSGTGTWGYSDITKIVLTKDIDIPNLANDPDITFATPSTGAGATVRSTGAINNVNHDPYMLNFSQINNYGSLTSPSAPHSGKYSGQDGGEWNLRIIHSSNKPDDLTTEISGKVQSTFTIDGQGHTWNLGNFSIFLRQDRAANITLNNMKIYGSNYFGPIRTANMTSVPTVLTYKDITYYGSQLLYSNSGVTVHFQGDCIGYALYSYIGPDGNVYSCQGTITGSAQQLLEGQNINFDADCNFKGYTYGGHVLLVTGNVTVGDRANVELHPHYMRGGPNHNSAAEAGVVSAGNTPIGLAVVGNQGDLTMQHNAQLNIIVDRKPLADSIPTADKGLILKDKNDTWYDSRMTDGFYATPLALSLSGRGNLQYVTNSNSVINIKSDGAIGSNNLINLTGGQANIGEGEMNVEAKNLGNNNGATASLLSTSNAANIFVDRNGSFSMSAPKATSRVYLINSRGSCRINIYKPKKLHLERPNKASVLLHGTGNVEMHGVKETALADNPDDPSGPDISIRDTQFQYLNLPFSSDRLQSSANGTTMSAQTSAINLVKLKQLLAQLSPNNNSSFPQFRVFDATAIDPGPVIAKPLPTIDPQHRLIEGDVVDDNTTRQPAIGARLHVTLTRTGSSTPIDLGDSGATVAELNPNKDSLDPGNIFATPAPTPTAVEPDEGLWFEHHHDSSGMATNDLTAKGNLLAQPWRYVTDSKVVTWDNTGHFQLDVDKLIAEYDKNNAANPIGTLVPNDKLQITVVNNFQASVVKTVKISSLYLNLNDKQAKKYYVLGDDIQVP